MLYQSIIQARKIVLATNIAETSLTIPDIDYVIDCGKQRMKLYEPGSQISMWCDNFVSQSSTKQRSGRCGRIPGTHGYTAKTKRHRFLGSWAFVIQVFNRRL